MCEALRCVPPNDSFARLIPSARKERCFLKFDFVVLQIVLALQMVQTPLLICLQRKQSIKVLKIQSKACCERHRITITEKINSIFILNTICHK